MLLPSLFAEMNSTGHAGHCILASRVLGLVLEELKVPSEPLCVDYEFANAAAVQQMAQGRELVPPAMIAKTGSDGFDGYKHHVVTIVRAGNSALLLDPTIIQLERYMPSVSVSPVMVTLPWPRQEPLPIEIGGGRLTYWFRTGLNDFLNNEQWTDIDDAKRRATAVLRHMGR